MDFGTVLAIAAVNLVIGGWLKVDQHRAEDRADKKIDAFKEEMSMFHREHAESNKRILDLEMERKYGGKSC